MTFKWKITTPDRVTRADGVELCIPGISCEFETGSGSEAVGVFEAEDAAFTKIFGYSPIARVDFGREDSAGEPMVDESTAAPNPQPETVTAAGKTRGRPRKSAPEAVAPDPIPVPPPVADPLPNTAAAAPGGPAAAAPLPAQPSALPTPSPVPTPAPDVPAFLDRRPAAAPPPPLPPVTAPPIAAAAPPPVGVLGPKVVAALDEIKKRGTDDGAALSTWLADCGLTIKGASYDDACRAVLMISDAKLTVSGVVEALKVTA